MNIDTTTDAVDAESVPSPTNAVTREEARTLLSDAIAEGFQCESPVLIEALPTIGKSSGVVEWAAATGKPLTVLTSRHTLFDQYADWCEKAGLSYRRLPSFFKNCPTADKDNDEVDEEWAKRVKKTYEDRGLSGGEIHRAAESLYGEPLPCEDAGCPYLASRHYDPDDYDVLVGNYVHAHGGGGQLPSAITDRYVAIDEFPENAYLTEYSWKAARNRVNYFLADHNLPVTYATALRDRRYSQEEGEHIEDWFSERGISRESTATLRQDKQTNHTSASLLAFILLKAETLGNGWRRAPLPTGGVAVISPVLETVSVFSTPDLSDAESVIGLDGTPSVEKWQLVLGADLQHTDILTPAEKQAYLRDTLQLKVVQTTQDIKPYMSGQHVAPCKDVALLEGIARRHETPLCLISSKRANAKYEELELLDVIEEKLHYNALKGENCFSKKRLGVVFGSRHLGDDELLRWGALLDQSFTRKKDSNGEDTRGTALTYGDFGDALLHHDREDETLQAIMRFGRDGKGATVYVHTSAIPEWVERTVIEPRIWFWTGENDGMGQVIAAIKEHGQPEWTNADILPHVSISRVQVNNHHHSLVEWGFLDSDRRGGRGNPNIWIDTGLHAVGKLGHVDFPEH